MSVHNARSLPCLSSLSLPAFASLLPLPLCLAPSFPSQVWSCCLSWHSCGRDPLGMVRLGALVCKESWKWTEEVVRVPARLGKAGSFPHAHLGPGHLCRWPQLRENSPSGKLLAWDQASSGSSALCWTALGTQLTQAWAWQILRQVYQASLFTFLLIPWLPIPCH